MLCSLIKKFDRVCDESKAAVLINLTLVKLSSVPQETKGTLEMFKLK